MMLHVLLGGDIPDFPGKRRAVAEPRLQQMADPRNEGRLKVDEYCPSIGTCNPGAKAQAA